MSQNAQMAKLVVGQSADIENGLRLLGFLRLRSILCFRLRFGLCPTLGGGRRRFIGLITLFGRGLSRALSCALGLRLGLRLNALGEVPARPSNL